MNKSELLAAITDNVRKKHPWSVAEHKYASFFGELPREYLNERLNYDALLAKAKSFRLLHLVLSETKIEVNLNLDELIRWEIARWEEAAAHNVLPNDIRKLLKDKE